MSHDPRPSRYLIYGLIDPRDKSLRYVGKTHMRREHRLRRHLDNAANGGTVPVYSWIRELQAAGLEPHVFVIARLPRGSDWRTAEAETIQRWREWPESELPYTHPPMTPKSTPTLIERVELLNVQCRPQLNDAAHDDAER